MNDFRNLPATMAPEGIWDNVFSSHAFDIEVAWAEGIYLYDPKGERYIDATGGPIAVNIGHGEPRVIEAIITQAREYAYVHPYLANRKRAELCAEIAKVTPGDLNTSFLVSGGSEAVETAIKAARQYHVLTGSSGKHQIIGCYESYHGMTLATMALSGNPGYAKYFDPMLPKWPHVQQYSDHRKPPGMDRDEWAIQCAADLAEAIYYAGADNVAAFIATPIGCGSDYGLVAPPKYWQEVRRICDENNVLLIADEVVTGFGRTGSWFGMDHHGVVADIMVTAKGIASANAPLGACTVSNKVKAPFDDEPFLHGFTYQGHPLACAAGLAVLGILHEDNLVEHSRSLGEHLHTYREQLLTHPTVADVRGRGLFLVMELVENKQTGGYFDPERGAEHLYQAIGLKNGLAFYSSLYGSRRGAFRRGLPMWVCPPLTITRDEVDDLMQRLDQTLAEWEESLGVS